MTKGFKIIGISARTTNKNNQASRDLSKLWERFYSKEVFASIPNKISNDILAVYTDYKSDYTDEYTAIIGVQVSKLDNIPDGLIAREFGAENFQKYIAKGEMPNAVIDTWIDIWRRDIELNRKYTYDFEIYKEKSPKGEELEVEIFIAIK